jgi:predicted nucleic acid-binding protein
MRFWDSSAVVPLLVDEAATNAVRHLLSSDPVMLVWSLTGVEVTSALWRRARSGELEESGRQLAEEGLGSLERTWTAISALEQTAARAKRLLAVHGLRAADSLQLSAALLACDEDPRGQGFVTLDDRLADAARREGFAVLP